MKQHYIKKDLIDYADIYRIDSVSELWHRDDAIESVLPEEAEISYHESNDYQGEYALVVLLDGYIWVETGYFGSCSGCDSFLAHKRNETERILQDAYCFEDVDSLARWALESEALEMTHGSADIQLRDALIELGFVLPDD